MSHGFGRGRRRNRNSVGAIRLSDAQAYTRTRAPAPGPVVVLSTTVWICYCKSVSSTELQRLIDGGAHNLKQIGIACGAGTDCGHCKRTMMHMLEASSGNSKTRQERT